ncbi:MAG: LysR family transcriptional regulator [Silicimonas sp.]|nr:LysR family transcriptional regulator [Silicimonas sp.]
MSIKIEMLRAFAHVAQSGNLAEAAGRLGRTQSALSMTLKQLEDHLGERLFEGERKNRLTPLGEQVFALAQQQIQSFEAAIREIETSARAPQGLLRIGSIPTATGSLVPASVGRLSARFPGLKVDIRDTDTHTVIDALLRGQADVGIVSGEHALNGLAGTLLYQDRFGLICGPSHPLAETGDEVALEDVLAQGFIGNNLCQQIENEAIDAALAETRVHAHNTFSLIGLLRTGGWTTILPRSVARDLPVGLAFRDIRGLSAERAVTVYVAERSSQRGFAEAFVETLVSEVAGKRYGAEDGRA